MFLHQLQQTASLLALSARIGYLLREQGVDPALVKASEEAEQLLYQQGVNQIAANWRQHLLKLVDSDTLDRIAKDLNIKI